MNMQTLQRRTLITLATLATTSIAIAPNAWAQNTANPKVKLETSLGAVVLELDSAKAPKSAENFVQYVKDGHYNGTVFHRVIDGFMVQGGGFTADMQQKPTRAPIANEAANGLKNTKYTIAMARTGDPHSATAQFFINVADNVFLNHTAPTPQGWGYAVFGKVVSGTEVIDKMRLAPTSNRGMHQNVPTTPITILKATLEN